MTPGRGQAAGLDVLLVEDQTIIALDAEAMLADLGAASVQSFTTSDAALAWLAAGHCDLGVLDIALGGLTSYPVAEVLVERRIPFVFTTGYGSTHFIPPRFSAAPVVRKPYGMDALAEALARCLAGGSKL
jgi:CheY-like chemotaxis protein